MIVRIALVALVASASCLPHAAAASSTDAWAAFRTDVVHRCTAAAKRDVKTPYAVLVGDFGTPSYGIAIVYSRPPQPAGAIRGTPPQARVCVYRKSENIAGSRVEISDPVPAFPGASR